MTTAFIVFDKWFWHPYVGKGYQFWSGLGSDAGEATLVIAVVSTLVAFWRHRNCHVHGCWRLQWHIHPTHGHPVCRHHHPASNAEHLEPEHHS